MVIDMLSVQEAAQDLDPLLPELAFWYPGILLADILFIYLEDILFPAQDGEVRIHH